MSNFESIKPIPEEATRGWTISSVDKRGRRRPLKSRMIIGENSRMGTRFAYGMQPEGFDGLGIRELNGGGSVTIPYFWKDGNLYVGAIKQERKKSGGFIREVSRGFSIPNESHEQTAKREFGEETGVKESLSSRIKSLGKKGSNGNSTYFFADKSKGEGVKYFGLEVRPEEVQRARMRGEYEEKERTIEKNPRNLVYEFTPQFQREIKEVNEKIKPDGIKFFHASVLINTTDHFTKAAIGELLARK